MTEVEQEQSELPKGWAETRIGDICDLINGRAFKPSEWASNGVPIIRIQNLNDPKAEFNYCNFEVEEKYFVDNGQLLFAWSGTPGTSFGAHIWNRGKAVLNQHIFKVNINEDYFDKTFLKHLLNRNVKEYIGKAHGTAGLAHITKGKFEESQILLPSFNEQKRIANKIEELFSFLDAGVGSLRKVQAQLKRYRQAVLKYAFEGKLTEEWRKTHKDQIEPAEELLKESNQTKLIGESLVDNSILQKLPREWEWIRLNTITESMKNGIYKPKNFYSDKGCACLRMYNIDKGAIIWKDIKRMSLTKGEIEEYGLKAGDVLVNRVNSRELVGKSAVIPEGLETCVYESKNIRLRLNKKLADSKYVNFWLLYVGQKYFNRNAQQTVGMASINQEQLGSMPLPFCSLQEQQQIIEELERTFSAAENSAKTVRLSMAQTGRLRQSILKKAFEGRLVPQDPEDEPAERLLKRIEAERMEHKKEGSERINNYQSRIDGQAELSRYVQ